MELSTSFFDTKQPKPSGSPGHCWQPSLPSHSKPGTLWAESREHNTCGAFNSVTTILSFKNKALKPKELPHLEIRSSSTFCIFYFGISNTKEVSWGGCPGWTTAEPCSFPQKSRPGTHACFLQRSGTHTRFQQGVERNEQLRWSVIPWVTVFLSHNFLNEVTSHIHWRTKRQENTHQRIFLRAVENIEKLEHTLLMAQRPISAQALLLLSVSHSSSSDIRWLLSWKGSWAGPLAAPEKCAQSFSLFCHPHFICTQLKSLPHLPIPLFSQCSHFLVLN